MHYRKKKYSCITIGGDCGYIKTLWLHLMLIIFCLCFFFSFQNRTLGTASVLYKPSKMCPPSTCRCRSRQAGEAGCCYLLREWKTTCFLSSWMEKCRWICEMNRTEHGSLFHRRTQYAFPQNTDTDRATSTEASLLARTQKLNEEILKCNFWS